MNNNSSISAEGSHFINKLREVVKNLPPAYFAMVMSTGIISISHFMLKVHIVAHILFWLNIVFYILLGILNILRILFYRKDFLYDMIDHQKGPGFFTIVAGSCILGSQFIIIYNDYSFAFALWIIGIILWVIFNYTIFTALTVKENKPSLDQGITGAWLLAVVATQSIAALSTLIAAHLEQPYKLQMNFLALCMWMWGGMLYIWMISLIFYRYTFFKLFPGDLSPPYWINMGAMAISTLAGSLLISSTHHAPFLESLIPFVKGFTIFYWATGTWWIPMLFVLAIWRHIYKRFPLKYDPLYWGAVFPLGMYTACTFHMADSMDIYFLEDVPKYFIYIALTAWLAAFIGFLHSVYDQFNRFISRNATQ
ncbi:MAG: C4-dicarboxylate ABC transporter [Ignavibacteriota bacterium]|nr:MAG: C4-dicarboxylate ABC transporter [Chlorobiota bacterium]MBE7476856.1 tellurite resistance/C4-dicarboxylate transporter family protein [Ignavibacteriales bacterium]MBL1121893.1 C4-dicarboxylate ABC transporter [Ignavibacteriota bacterium]MCC7094384.1 tellurite resistance/C4-dicarboxylate transporter family protein [Ignavibacteriaceae bacterium]MCE7855552.1 C4-dicarboxylate ABC transporter [Ignavibacteria bacterium CHB3]MEB2297853.1 tellurite resistance/C4-dicarboxylate transporter famil